MRPFVRRFKVTICRHLGRAHHRKRLMEKSDHLLEYFRQAAMFLGKLTQDTGGGHSLVVIERNKPLSHLLAPLFPKGTPMILEKWQPGCLTNRATFYEYGKKLVLADPEHPRNREILMRRRMRGDVSKLQMQRDKALVETYNSPKNRAKRKKFEGMYKLAGPDSRPMDLPACAILMNASSDTVPVKELSRLQIPIIGVVDSDADASLIDYPIPANTGAVTSQFMFGHILAEVMCRNAVASPLWSEEA